jgi:hypothetical protein
MVKGALEQKAQSAYVSLGTAVVATGLAAIDSGGKFSPAGAVRHNWVALSDFGDSAK